MDNGDSDTEARRLIAQWDLTLIAASIGVSFLGAFTSTQLMCQAKTSRHSAGAFIWTGLGSLTFGFCSIWSLHEIAMLGYGLDLRIGISVGLTVLSALLAVFFTFIALAFDMLYARCWKRKRRVGSNAMQRRASAHNESLALRTSSALDEPSLEPLLPPTKQMNSDDSADGTDLERALLSNMSGSQQRPSISVIQSTDKAVRSSSGHPWSERSTNMKPAPLARRHQSQHTDVPTLEHRDSQASMASEVDSDTGVDTASYQDVDSRRSSSFATSTTSALGLGGIMGLKRHPNSKESSANAFVATYYTLRARLNVGNIVKGFFWAIAITSMHYVGIWGLRVPQGYVSLNPYLVILSLVICWIVCVVGCILILEIETNLGQQVLFSVVATCGVAAMHFTGMRAATFYSFAEPTSDRGYPPGLATAVVAVAISTCLLANLLLVHLATVSRNKLAEIVWTRRKLWMAIAQKESAETAALARSEFIASASHEIRTPLHHLQGYSDLLSRTEMTEEGRLLLYAIQRATKTLSLITNNVLDWSRLENDGEATCRPVSVDIRTICESIITLLPNQDEDIEVEVMVVVAFNVPHSLFIDETYIHRILMNLLSNALKFTSSGYILLSVEMKDDNLVASVKDTGSGIPPTFIPQLFEPFKQAQVRGKARGTGLGLSIIKQLLRKMQGTIDVHSKYQDDEDVGPERSGSTFTITVPVQHPLEDRLDQANGIGSHKIRLFHGGSQRTLEGLQSAWEKFGYEVIQSDNLGDLTDPDTHYIWVDLPALRHEPQLLYQLYRQTATIVLLPYDTQLSLQQVIGGGQLPPHIVPIQKPLLWHTFKRSIDVSAMQLNKSNVTRAVRFDPVVTDLEEPLRDIDQPPEPLTRQQSFAEVGSVVEAVVREKSPEKGRVILLVEDNPINAKLGKKMLHSLGYQVVLAEDGAAAIEQITQHDALIDAILMDQSMPVKDGLTATKEIRAMETNGVLSRTRPIIAVSAVVSTEAQTLFRLAGANDFLAKPLSLGRLENTLAMHLRP